MYFIKRSIKRLLFQQNLYIFAVMTNPSASAEAGNRTVVAQYVATLSAELAIMAKRSGLDTVSFLLEMVRLEAESETRHSENGGG
jgi:hypothetical protein